MNHQTGSLLQQARRPSRRIPHARPYQRASGRRAMDRKSAYAVKLRDPRWQKLRLEVLQRDNWTCQVCGDTETTLHVHHGAYYGDDPWDTPPTLLFCICSECHEKEHEEHKLAVTNLLGSLARIRCVTSADIDRLATYIDHDAFIVADGRHSNDLSVEEWASAFNTAIDAFVEDGNDARRSEWNAKCGR